MVYAVRNEKYILTKEQKKKMKKRIVIIDDSVFIYEEMKALLEDSDYEIAGYAKCAEEGMKKIMEIQPDGVTMDIILPGIDGFEATRWIREKYPEIKVLTVSSLAYSETIEESERSGANGFIFKPFDRESLVTALDKIFADGKQHSKN